MRSPQTPEPRARSTPGGRVERGSPHRLPHEATEVAATLEKPGILASLDHIQDAAIAPRAVILWHAINARGDILIRHYDRIRMSPTCWDNFMSISCQLHGRRP